MGTVRTGDLESTAPPQYSHERAHRFSRIAVPQTTSKPPPKPPILDREVFLEKAVVLASKKTLIEGDVLKGFKAMYSPTQRLEVLGLAPAVIFFLRCMLESCIAFALILVVQWPLHVDIVQRTEVRNECRSALAAFPQQPTPDPPPESLRRCGYAGHSIALDLKPIGSLSQYCYLGCEEFTVEDWGGAPWLANFEGTTVDTNEAEYCASGGINTLTLLYWYGDLVIVILYLMRMLHLESAVELEADKGQWTTADYAVMLRGLDRGVPLQVAALALMSDLMRLGFDENRVHHLEFGLLPKPPDADALEGLSELTSGQAFIVFQYETDRNRMLEQHKGQLQFELAARQNKGNGVMAVAGPEPSNVLWENLHVLPKERRKRFWMTQRAIGCTLVVSSIMLVTIQFLKRTYTKDFAVGGTEDAAFLSTGYFMQLLDRNVQIALVAALAIAVVAWKVRDTIRAFHSREGHETRGEFEAGLLAKLSGAFTCNNVIMPIVVSMAQCFISEQSPVGQNFYERTAFPTMAVVIMSIQRITADLPRALQLVSVFKRCKTRCEKPKDEADAVAHWDPPGMALSLQMAQFYWLFACALLYGPFGPFYYALAAIYAFWSFLCTKFGVTFWYKRMPAIPTQLGRVLRQLVVALLPFQLLLKLAVRWAAEPQQPLSAHLLLFSVGAVIVTLVISSPLARGGLDPATSGGNGYQQISELDTHGITYGRVEELRGYPIDCYINPFRRTETRYSVQTRRGFFGEPAPTEPNTLDRSSETIDHNVGVISTAFPFEALASG